MTQIYHHVKFRWTENLTSRFIHLRKENGKLFTGRKYSAQAGWEYILRQMKQEFPTIMADVPFRVLKKKWSNLLQQYKELKNPVHGDKNKADDVSWPFYGAIDEIVLGQDHYKSMMRRPSKVQTIDDIEEEEEIDPHEFLCVSVTPLDEQISPPSSPTIDESKLFSQHQQQEYHKYYDDDTPIQVVEEEFSRSRATTEKFESTPTISVRNLTSLRRSTGNQSRMTHQQQLQIIQTAVNHAKRPREQLFVNEKNNKMRKMTLTGSQRSRNDNTTNDSSSKQSQRDVVKKINEFFNYTKQRDEENRLIMLKILTAVEKIANKLD